MSRRRLVARNISRGTQLAERLEDGCHLLGLTAPFVVLTNNPDKVEALRAQGIAIAGTEALEFEPSPFNLAYLTSKAAAGHILTRPAETTVRRAVPPWRGVVWRVGGAKGVLELPVGTIDSSETAVGDQISIGRP